MTNNDFNWEDTKQLTPIQIFLAFFLPSAFAFTGFRIVLPKLVANGVPVLIGWPGVASVMLFILVLIGLTLLKKEAKELNISLSERMCLKKLPLKQWGLLTGIIVIGVIVTVLSMQLVTPFMALTGMSIPSYMPFFLDPSIDPMTTSPAILSPGLALKGNSLLIPFIALTLFLNILAEELYFRAWILPKLSSYKNLGWVLNGVFFALYHTFQLWLLPGILVGSLFIAFVIYKGKSIWPAFAQHMLINMMTVAGMAMLILG
jgi:uncharacterized protein